MPRRRQAPPAVDNFRSATAMDWCRPTRRARSPRQISTGKPLSPAEAAALAAAFKAIDDSRWTRCPRRGRQLQQSAAEAHRRLERAAGRAQDRRRLRLDLALPARESRLARARGAAPPGRGPHRPRRLAATRSCATSPPFRRSPARATCAAWRQQRRPVPTTCRGSRATAGATPPSATPTRTTSSTSTAAISSATTRSPASTASCATAARRSRAISCPSCRPTTSRSPMRGWPWPPRRPMRRPC